MTYIKVVGLHEVKLYDGKYKKDEITTNFANRLKMERERMGLSYSKLSKILMVGHTTLHEVETGRTTVLLSTAARIAIGLGLSLDDMVMGR